MHLPHLIHSGFRTSPAATAAVEEVDMPLQPQTQGTRVRRVGAHDGKTALPLPWFH